VGKKIEKAKAKSHKLINMTENILNEMNLIKPAMLIPLLPLLGFFITSLFGKQLKHAAGWIASFAILVPFICSAYIFMNTDSATSFEVPIFDWIAFGKFSIPFAFLIDPLSILMLLVVTGIGFLIHIYSIGYMHHDEGFSRFFSYLNLFIFFMLLLVMGNNYLVMFIGWEGVGLCSYLLIGFWFKNQSYNDAAKKAFIMNRIGDLGFLLGMFFLMMMFGSLEYKTIFSKASEIPVGTSLIVITTLLLFVGAMGKSAQIPLYTWLPDAMAGPTPVSALIHAATMVTAGIYMITRSHVLFALAPFTSEIILIVGAATALFASIIGLKQNDIKKVLAYSTVSQLGFMFAALGVGAYKTAMFHVLTHAFFKALLFLGSGSVIHAMGGEQDIRKMGGLRKSLPITNFTFLIGTLAISGVPLFAGFFSKDEILANVFVHSNIFFGFLVLTSIITSIYMFRVYFLTFSGEFRGTEEQKHHLHESPVTITIPLIILAVLSTVGGFLGLPSVFHATHKLNEYLGNVVPTLSEHEVSHNFEYILMGSLTAIVAIIIFAVFNYFISKKNMPEANEEDMNPVGRFIYNKYYVDEFYNAVFVRPVMLLSDIFLVLIDKLIIDLFVNALAWLAISLGKGARLVQTGNTGFYVFAMVISMIVLLALQFII
jgi:NADH-quinone oxidoreductase subunit L